MKLDEPFAAGAAAGQRRRTIVPGPWWLGVRRGRGGQGVGVVEVRM